MAKRGRASSAELIVAKTIDTSLIGVSQRLPAPKHLTDAELSVWLEVVNDQPASSFTPTHAPLLEMYCRHVVNARKISDEVLSFDIAWIADDDGLKRYDRLLAMAERESRAASSLATRLRITRQSIDQQTVARTIKNDTKAKKPWEFESES
jgi:hypothetical protein